MHDENLLYMEEQLLICLGQACNDTNVLLYLVDEIIQDECDKVGCPDLCLYYPFVPTVL